jgi:hypothetical protein
MANVDGKSVCADVAHESSMLNLLLAAVMVVFAQALKIAEPE